MSSAVGEVGSPTRRNSFGSPPPPAAIIRRRRPRRVRREAESYSIAHPNASPPPLLLKRKPDVVSPSAPLKPVRRRNEPAFLRDPYQAAMDRQRAASVAAALEHAFWAPKMANAGAEGVELKKIEDFLIEMTGAKLAQIPL